MYKRQTVEYLSYYDKTSYTETYGFQDVEEGKNYDKQYQHQVLPSIVDFHVKKGPVISQLTVAEVYSRDANKSNEKITRLSIEAARSGIDVYKRQCNSCWKRFKEN